MPATVASAVIMMGRRRRSPARIMLSSAGMPSARNFWSASSSRIPFLATMPITMISPMNEERLNVVPVTSSARNTPQVESSAEESTAIGAAKLPNSNSSTMNTSTIGQNQHEARDPGTIAAALRTAPPYSTRMLGGIFRSAMACCTWFMPSPRFSLRSGRSPATLRCRLSRRISVWPGVFRHAGQRAERGGLAGAADQHGLADGIERGARRSGKRTRMV